MQQEIACEDLFVVKSEDFEGFIREMIESGLLFSKVTLAAVWRTDQIRQN